MDADAGVYVGIMNSDFTTLLAGSAGIYAATGATIAIAAGRLSFTIVLQARGT